MTVWNRPMPARARFVVPAVAALAAALPAWVSASAMDIALDNPSFEQPPVTPQDPDSQNPADYVLPFVTGWDETGPEVTEQGFTGLLDTGVFFNQQYNFGTEENPSIVPAVPNADGDKLAYLRYNIDAGTSPENPVVSLSQQTSAVYDTLTDYTFTLGVTASFLDAPGSADPVNNPSTVVLRLGYNDGSGGFVGLQDNVASVFDLNPDGSLKDFDVTVLGDSLSGDALGEQVVVRVEQVGGDTGSFSVDNARLTAVPEPTGLAMLAIGGAMVFRRRR